jgi:ribosomal protein L6P/L9E
MLFLRTIRSTFQKIIMITGVSAAYKFKMALAYSHFSIVVNATKTEKIFFL